MASNFLMVALGAAFGGLLRVVSTGWIKSRWKSPFPMATFVINILGSLVLGMVAGVGLESSFSLLLGTGFLGSFTTFSTFNVESVELLRRKKYLFFLIFSGGSYVFGITAIFIGMAIGRLI